MLEYDIQNVNEVICKNIKKINGDLGFVSQNILPQIRTLVELISIKIYGTVKSIPVENNIVTNKKSLKYIRSQGKYKFFSKLHDFLQAGTSHFTVDEDNSERLLIRYLPYLHQIKEFAKKEYNLEILHNLSDIPLPYDETHQVYYDNISSKIENKFIKGYSAKPGYYYIHKKKMFISNGKIYYELTLVDAVDNYSKFDRIIVFTHFDVLDNYAVQVMISNDEIDVFGVKTQIRILTKWEVSIRVCELNRILQIIGSNHRVSRSHSEYKALMKYLTESGHNILDIINLDDDYYLKKKEEILGGVKVSNFFLALDHVRHIIKRNLPGCNLLRYILYSMRNKIVRDQYNKYEPCPKLSNLYLHYKAIPFDKMPFASSLRKHNVPIHEKIEAIPSFDKEYEFVARKILYNTEQLNKIYTKSNELEKFSDLDKLVSKYNDCLYYKHRPGRKIEKYREHYYIHEYENNTISVLNSLMKLTETGIDNYYEYVTRQLSSNSYIIDDDEKKSMISELFIDTSVFCLYGAAGTGKTKMIEHLSYVFRDLKLLFLTNTHPALNNIKRRVKRDDVNFKTIASLVNGNQKISCDILVIDECSMVGNDDMKSLLDLVNFGSVLLVGDIYQIEAIKFGNWFSIAKSYLPKKAIGDLLKPWRAESAGLLNLWSLVRENSEKIPEMLAVGNYSSELNESVFTKKSADEIILCLNYDGLYGINNINHVLQSENINEPIEWDMKIYKIGDPILFNDSSLYYPVIYNNMKGKIKAIKKDLDYISFDIMIWEPINPFLANTIGLEVVTSNDNETVIRMRVYSMSSVNKDEDYDEVTNSVPFQIAYSVSIHKAQGLEYDSVKVIITNEVEERVSHNIFYTAITRAKKYLQVYWGKGTQNRVLSNMKLITDNLDYILIKDKLDI